MSTQVYIRLAREQHTASLGGRAAWRKFVARAERETQVPWEVLRDILDPYCRAFYALRDAQSQDTKP